MAWRAKCYECGQDVPITRPVFATAAAHAEGDLGRAAASYEAHLARPPASHPCSAV